MKRIAIAGAGYVGVVLAACLADLGNAVTCVDNDERKIARLAAGDVPMFEPSLPELVGRNLEAGRLAFGTDVGAAVAGAELIFVAVGTPPGADGAVDLSAVRAVAREIGLALNGPKIVVSKSTVPVETSELISSIVREHAAGPHAVSVVSNPEFLREGSAVADFFAPDRIVIGTSDPAAERALRELYAPLNAPIVTTDVRTAEMIKYAANAFLATKVSFINEIANICALAGVDVGEVCHGIGYDRRIGTEFLRPGIGYGGSCLPKDVRALERLAHAQGYEAPLLRAVELVNERQCGAVVALLETALGTLHSRTVTVLGLAFKPETDDLREAPALAIVRRLCARGALVTVHDPVANDGARAALPAGVTLHDDPYAALTGADAVLLATEWAAFLRLDLARAAALMRGDLIVDGRNALEPAAVRAAGLRYAGIGRALSSPGAVEARR